MPLEFPGARQRSFARSRSRPGEDLNRRSRWAGNLILWTTIFALLIAGNAAIWTFSLLVFGYPERPFNYRLLTRLEKLEPLEEFPALSAPRGRLTSPKDIYEKFHGLSPAQLNALNSRFLREYVENYRETAEPLNYLRGTFRVYQVKDLTEDDLFTSGVALRAICQDYPQVVVEFIMPSASVPEKHFAIGDDLAIDVDGPASFAAILHIEKLPDYKICFSAVPITYSSYNLPGGGKLALAPPEVLNIAAGLPVTEEAIGAPPEAAGIETP